MCDAMTLMSTIMTFALIVCAHPYYTRNSCPKVMTHHSSSACTEKTFIDRSRGRFLTPILTAKILIVETEISITRLARFSYEHIKIFKEIGVRQDLRNRASPVNWAHTKRPTSSILRANLERYNSDRLVWVIKW